MKREDFAARLGDHFVLEREAPVESPGEVELALVEVTALAWPGRPPARGRSEPFSCLFRGPAESRLGQGTHVLAHPALGRLALFLVPVGPAEGGLGYEAIFA